MTATTIRFRRTVLVKKAAFVALLLSVSVLMSGKLLEATEQRQSGTTSNVSETSLVDQSEESDELSGIEVRLFLPRQQTLGRALEITRALESNGVRSIKYEATDEEFESAAVFSEPSTPSAAVCRVVEVLTGVKVDKVEVFIREPSDADRLAT